MVKKLKLKFRKLKTQEFSAKPPKPLVKGPKYIQPEEVLATFTQKYFAKNLIFRQKSPKTSNLRQGKSNTLHLPENRPKKACASPLTSNLAFMTLMSK